MLPASPTRRVKKNLYGDFHTYSYTYIQNNHIYTYILIHTCIYINIYINLYLVTGEETMMLPASPMRRVQKNFPKKEESPERMIDENNKKYKYYQGKLLLKSDDVEDFKTIASLNHQDPLGEICNLYVFIYACMFLHTYMHI
jgi:hypothetical protein